MKVLSVVTDRPEAHIMVRKDLRPFWTKLTDSITGRKPVEGVDYTEKSLYVPVSMSGPEGTFVLEADDLRPELGVKLKQILVSERFGMRVSLYGVTPVGVDEEDVYSFVSDYYDIQPIAES